MRAIELGGLGGGREGREGTDLRPRRCARWPQAQLIPALTGLGALALLVSVVEAVIVGIVVPEGAFWTLPMGALFCAGALCARRRPQELAARRLLLIGTAAIVWMGGGLGLGIAYRQLGQGSWLVVPNTLMVFLDCALPAAILAGCAVYPEGRLQRAYERRLVRVGAALTVIVPIVLLLARPRMQPMLAFGWLVDYTGPKPVVASPLHAGALDFLGGPASFYAGGAIGILCAIAVVLLVLRYRRFDAELRLRTRWPLVAMALAALQPLGDALASAGVIPPAAVNAPVIVAITALAVALAIGLLNPRLFDLGHVVRRTLAYVALWVAIGALYVGIAGAAGVAAAGEGLQVAIAVAIAVTLLAEPARRAVARRAARWAYGERVSGPELLRRLGDALEHTLEPDELARTLAETIREGLGVDWVRLSVDARSLAARADMAAPADAAETVAVAVARGADAPARDARVGASAPLSYGGESLGTLECAPAAPPVDPLVLGNLARQAALAMGNARLAIEARTRAQELAASRTRIVEAQETARRRLERDIHDGVQQELVALIAKLGLARGQAERDPGALATTLVELQAEVRRALAELRELASGIHPSVLGDRGIVEAIEERASRLPLGVTIECAPGLRRTRFPEPVEGAAYFVVCEGLANALKHSGAGRVTVRLRTEGASLALEVCDDGRGFEPGAAEGGSGLAGLADRVDALGGSFAVRSADGQGTALRARLPVGAAAPAPAGAEDGAADGRAAAERPAAAERVEVERAGA